MVKVLAFDVDGVLTCHGCSKQRHLEHLQSVRHMIAAAKRNGFVTAVDTARTYRKDGGLSRAKSLSGVHPAIAEELRNADDGNSFLVCSRASGQNVPEKKMSCLREIADAFRRPADSAEQDSAILVEDNRENYSRAGGSLGQKGDASSSEGEMYTAGVLVPHANGVTPEVAHDLARIMRTQQDTVERVRKARGVLAATFDLDLSIG